LFPEVRLESISWKLKLGIVSACYYFSLKGVVVFVFFVVTLAMSVSVATKKTKAGGNWKRLQKVSDLQQFEVIVRSLIMSVSPYLDLE
jgi:hypothetical protein